MMLHWTVSTASNEVWEVPFSNKMIGHRLEYKGSSLVQTLVFICVVDNLFFIFTSSFYRKGGDYVLCFLKDFSYIYTMFRTNSAADI